jgi:hypothetical protein
VKGGAVAQLVEQWTENPCVAGSIPAHTTKAGKLTVMLVFPLSFSAKTCFSGQSRKIPYTSGVKQSCVYIHSFQKGVEELNFGNLEAPYQPLN